MYTTVKYVTQNPLPPGNFQYGRKNTFEGRSPKMSRVQKYVFQNGVRTPLLSESKESIVDILMTLRKSPTRDDQRNAQGDQRKSTEDQRNIKEDQRKANSSAPASYQIHDEHHSRVKSSKSEISASRFPTEKAPQHPKSAPRHHQDSKLSLDIRINGQTKKEPSQNIEEAVTRDLPKERITRSAVVTNASSGFSVAPPWKYDKLPDVVLDRCYHNTYHTDTGFRVSLPEFKRRGVVNDDTNGLKSSKSRAKSGLSSEHLLSQMKREKSQPSQPQSQDLAEDSDQRQALIGDKGCLYSQIKQSMHNLRERPLKKEKGRYRPASNSSPSRFRSPVLCSPKDIRSADAYIRYMATMKFSPPKSPVFGRPTSGRRLRVNTAVSRDRSQATIKDPQIVVQSVPSLNHRRVVVDSDDEIGSEFQEVTEMPRPKTVVVDLPNVGLESQSQVLL